MLKTATTKQKAKPSERSSRNIIKCSQTYENGWK